MSGEEFDLLFNVAKMSFDYFICESCRCFCFFFNSRRDAAVLANFFNFKWYLNTWVQNTNYFFITLIQSIVAVEISKIERT